ncbi:MAG: hypothetical protein M2R45_00365 [Verrucomicrobia subdivision 3 bacterium]|nr:hypothetical protein [Limisphaerales bacterium]MCS1412877.1 hypothetical protein [Limisphaerales bacterium]
MVFLDHAGSVTGPWEWFPEGAALFEKRFIIVSTVPSLGFYRVRWSLAEYP